MNGIPQAPEARRYGFPAVLGHEVVAVSCVAREDWESSEPGHVCVIRWHDGGIASDRMPDRRLYVWARAGRVAFGDEKGTVDLVLLGEHEYEGLALGVTWPKDYSRTSRVTNIVHGAAEDLRNAVTFPASFPRMMRTSGERNKVLDTLVAWCKREIPGIHVLRGWLRGTEGPDNHQVPALPPKGQIGEHRWLDTTPGTGLADPAEHSDSERYV
jgi:hypothetical protein